MLSLVMAYRSFGRFWQARHPPRYAAFLTLPSPSFGHSSDASRPDLMPDLVFRPIKDIPSGDDGRYGIFVECKVLGSGKKEVPLYVTKGLYRFVSGDYAWAMSQSVMLGYVVQERHFPAVLNDYLNRTSSPLGRACKSSDKASTPDYIAAHAEIAGVCSTHHTRRFMLGRVDPGGIEVFHMWLRSPRVPSTSDQN